MVSTSLSAWAVYYEITGSSAAALTGLLFVVSTLVAGQERERDTVTSGVQNYTTPTVLHFCIALLLSGIGAAPWHGILAPAIFVVLGGAFGLYYAARILMRFADPTTYTPDTEDRFWYAVAPVISYLSSLLPAFLLLAPPSGHTFCSPPGRSRLFFSAYAMLGTPLRLS